MYFQVFYARFVTCRRNFKEMPYHRDNNQKMWGHLENLNKMVSFCTNEVCTFFFARFEFFIVADTPCIKVFAPVCCRLNAEEFWFLNILVKSSKRPNVEKVVTTALMGWFVRRRMTHKVHNRYFAWVRLSFYSETGKLQWFYIQQMD